MKVLLSSIAKNDIRLLMRVFNAEKENKGTDFLDTLQESISQILKHSEASNTEQKEVMVYKTKNFPVHIHYLFENKESLFITAIFKELQQ
ncbi:hypothetical protein [Chryseobacterium sp.]|uniref:hypothetical protein n=1 Tax=Chryseobacterium sp. TaxID=1871047 RepID=UPI0025BD709E|nr:hypothetical protein [Chryseobacterium sp.]